VIAIHDPVAAQYLAGMREGWTQSVEKLADVLGRAGLSK